MSSLCASFKVMFKSVSCLFQRFIAA